MALEIQGAADALIDEPLDLRVRGAGPDLTVVWRARLRDDDARVWRATADRAPGLAAGWAPAKGGAGAVAALHSLRPPAVDVRAELEDGRAAKRTITRRLIAEDVRVRRWRDGIAGTLYRPGREVPAATVVVDAIARAAVTAEAAATATTDPTAWPAAAERPDPTAVAQLAAPLLASRGVLVLVLLPGRGSTVAAATERLAAVPGAGTPIVLAAADVPVPPGVPTTAPTDDGAAWDALLARLGATPRG